MLVGNKWRLFHLGYLKRYPRVVIFYVALYPPTRVALITQRYGNPDEEVKIIDQLESLDVQEDAYILSVSWLCEKGLG